MTVDDAWVPAACTLPTVERPLRVREFDQLFADALVTIDRLEPTRLRMGFDGGEATAARACDLTARESECCSFFLFSLVAVGDRVVIEVGVPDAQVAVLDALAARAGQAAG